MAACCIVWARHGDGAGSLCHAIALNDGSTKADPQELHNLCAYRRRPSGHDPHMACNTMQLQLTLPACLCHLQPDCISTTLCDNQGEGLSVMLWFAQGLYLQGGP